VEVTDTSDTVPVAEPSDAVAAGADPDPDPDADTSGRGLAIVDALAERWGAHTRRTGGKTVWFEVLRTRLTP
jgi:serine/threonine-protein kinase RsbW